MGDVLTEKVLGLDWDSGQCEVLNGEAFADPRDLGVDHTPHRWTQRLGPLSSK